MKYWADMTTKYGFSDGGAVPLGVEHFRDIYIKTVNDLAAHNNSAVRVVPYNRAGMHNWCLVWFVLKDWFEQTYKPGLKTLFGLWTPPSAAELFDVTTAADSAMGSAIDKANTLDLDQLITEIHTVSVDHVAFYSLLQRLDAQANERPPTDET